MWSDKETLNDCLGYSNYVEVLANVCTRHELAPLTVGIFGAWGSGKTSLMTMLKDRLDQDAEKPKIRTLWFNAWKNEGRDEAQSALIHAILNKLREGRTLVGEVKDAWDQIDKGAAVLKLAKFVTKTAITLTPNLSDFLECFQQQSKDVAETLEKFDCDFEKLLESVDVSHIVVFIDDLDRCPSAKVIETFETIKLFLNAPRCSFVIGADSQRIGQAIADVYGVKDESRKKDFLEKIVQIPFNIPVQNPQDIACYVAMLVVGRHLKSDDAWKAFIQHRPQIYQSHQNLKETVLGWLTVNEANIDCTVTEIEQELNDILPYVQILGEGLRGNPRQIKRFLNILSLRRQLANANQLELDGALLVKMTVLEYVWEIFFTALIDTVDPESGFSILIGELVKEETDDEEEKSELVEGFAEMVRLVNFIKNNPALTAETDLRPYLFLAQTSINRGRSNQLLSLDERSQNLVQAIASKDRITSNATARRVAAEPHEVAKSVVQRIITTLFSSSDNQVKTHVMIGLDTICSKHKVLYEIVVKEIEGFDPGNSESLGLAGSTLLSNAEQSGLEVPSDLRERFTKAAGVLSALSRKTHTSKSMRG